MNAPTSAPVRKVVAATLGAAVATIILWLLGDVVGLSINEAVSAAIVTVIVFLVGYVVPADTSDVSGAVPRLVQQEEDPLNERTG